MDFAALIVAGRWGELKARVREGSAETSYVGISSAGRNLPSHVSVDGLIEGPDDVLGLAIAGGFNRYRAWRLRGYAAAEDTSDAQMARYIEALQEALDQLYTAVQLDPRNGLAVSFLASAAAELDDEETESIEELLASARDAPPSGYMALLNARTQKWGGSHAKMWEVAHRYRDRAKPGTLALIARAHFEHRFYLQVFDERPGAKAEARAYYRSADRLGDLRAASDESFELTPAAVDDELRLVDGWFARVLVEAGDRKRARRHLVRLGGQLDDWIWGPGILLSARQRLVLARLSVGLWPPLPKRPDRPRG